MLPAPLLHYFAIDNLLPIKKSELDVAERNPWTYPIVIEADRKWAQYLFPD